MTTVAPTTATDTRRQFDYKDPQTGKEVTIHIDDSRDKLLTQFGKSTLSDRYLVPGEGYQDLFARVACANSNEIILGTEDGHAQRIYDYISQHWFMPATPVLTNSGVDRGLPISCFLNKVGDSMESIAEAVNENVWLAAKGGGIGTDWSAVRSIDEPINGSITGTTSGIIPFIHWQDAQTLAISQGSLRRGSAAVYLNDRHPEIKEFLSIRRPTDANGGDPRRKAHNLHHGVLLSDEFMHAVRGKESEDRQWELRSPHTNEVIDTVDAREVWIKIVTNRLETGEPYIIFEGAVERGQPVHHKHLGLKVTQSNLCSEITLPTGEDYNEEWRTAVCCLSSVVLDTYDQWKNDEKFVQDVMEFLDNVLTRFINGSEGKPGLERARYSAMQERSVGLGMMGFHSYLQSKMIPYEDKRAQAMNKRIWKDLKEKADAANEAMAINRGACPDSVEAERNGCKAPLVRMSHMFSIAPTASISIIAGGSSPCGEPWPANSYNQKTLSGSFNVRNKHLHKLLSDRYDELQATYDTASLPMKGVLIAQPMYKGLVGAGTKEEWLEDQWSHITINDGSVRDLAYLGDFEKGVFRTAFEIDQRWCIEHAADRQPYVCQAQSVNVFLPANVHKTDLNKIHFMAWEKGLKSLYYLRSRVASKAMAVSNVAGEMPKAQIEERGPMYIDEPECLSCQ